MLVEAIAALDPRLFYGVSAMLLLALAIALLPIWVWLVPTAALLLSAAVACAKARRGGVLDLPEVRPTTLY